MPKPPPTKIRLSSVPAYLKLHHGFTVKRQTVYNWVKTGKKGTKLATLPPVAGMLFTTDRMVEEFVANVGV